MITGVLSRDFFIKKLVISDAYRGVQKKINELMARRAIHLLGKTTRPLSVNIAKIHIDRYKAFQLVYREYFRRGLCKESNGGIHYNPHAVLPTSKTLLINIDGKVLATATVIKDSPLGLPLDANFKEFTDQLRAKGAGLAEVTMLSLDKKAFINSENSLQNQSKLRLMLSLFSAVVGVALLNRSITNLVIMVHQRHADFYELIGFKHIAGAQPYIETGGKPGVLMCGEVGVILECFLKLGLKEYVAKSIADEQNYSESTKAA